MSLLDSGGKYEPCVVYPEVVTTDSDGNTITRPSTTGLSTKARFQIQGQSGTSSRRAEQQEEGFYTERVYTVRFPRSFTRQHGELGAQSEVEWRGDRYTVFGDAQRYTSSRRTDHVVYTLRRD